MLSVVGGGWDRTPTAGLGISRRALKRRPSFNRHTVVAALTDLLFHTRRYDDALPCFAKGVGCSSSLVPSEQRAVTTASSGGAAGSGAGRGGGGGKHTRFFFLTLCDMATDTRRLKAVDAFVVHFCAWERKRCVWFTRVRFRGVCDTARVFRL